MNLLSRKVRFIIYLCKLGRFFLQICLLLIFLFYARGGVHLILSIKLLVILARTPPLENCSWFCFKGTAQFFSSVLFLKGGPNLALIVTLRFHGTSWRNGDLI